MEVNSERVQEWSEEAREEGRAQTGRIDPEGPRMIRLVTLMCTAVVIGCASTPVPRAELAQAELAIEQAERNDASVYAPLEMRLARDKIGQAKEALDDEENLQARTAAEEALVDAQLASVKATRSRAEAAAKEMEKTQNALEQESQNER